MIISGCWVPWKRTNRSLLGRLRLCAFHCRPRLIPGQGTRSCKLHGQKLKVILGDFWAQRVILLVRVISKGGNTWAKSWTKIWSQLCKRSAKALGWEWLPVLKKQKANWDGCSAVSAGMGLEMSRRQRKKDEGLIKDGPLNHSKAFRFYRSKMKRQ